MVKFLMICVCVCGSEKAYLIDWVLCIYLVGLHKGLERVSRLISLQSFQNLVMGAVAL